MIGPPAGDDEVPKIGKCYIYREKPLEIAGFITALDANTVNEESLSTQFGGGEYRLQFKDEQNRFFKQVTVTIAGEPFFTSDAQEVDYRRRRGLPPKPLAPGTVAPGAEALSMKDVLLMLEQREDKRRQEEREREERRRDEELALFTKKAALEQEALDRRRREDEDRETRRKRDEDEREERRRKELRADEERRAQLHKEDMERQAQLFQSVIAMNKAAEASQKPTTDPVAMLVQGVELALRLRPGGEGGVDPDAPPDSPLVSIFKSLAPRLPEVLAAASQASHDVRAEMADTGQQRPRPQRKPDPNALVIRGPAAVKMRQLAAHLAAQGKDPAQALDQLANIVMRKRPKPLPPGVQTAKQAVQTPPVPAGETAPRVETKAEYDERTGTDRHTVTAEPASPSPVIRRARRMPDTLTV